MRATEICGEVFLRNMGCFSNRAAFVLQNLQRVRIGNSSTFFVVAVVRYIIIGINGICVLCISIVLQLFKCRKTKKNINGNPVS